MSRSALTWLQALNPAVYLVSILPGVAVWLLASETRIAYGALCSATFAVVLLQHAVNLFNDAKDWRLGADTEKHDSWVRVHGENPRIAERHAIISLLGGAFTGLSVLWLQQQLWILSFALPLVLLGLLYNFGRHPLSYTAAGEWVTALCYGPGVFGGLWLVARQPFTIMTLLGMAAFSAFSMALLFSHQPPQIETDRAAGKQSYAVRHGADRTYRAATILYILTLLLLVTGLWLQHPVLPQDVVFTAAAVLACVWATRAPPTPKRLMLMAALVFAAPALWVIVFNYQGVTAVP